MSTPSPSSTPRATQSETAWTKGQLRDRLLAARRTRPDTAGVGLLGLAGAATQGHRVVALYASTPPEPDTWPLLEALRADGVRVLLPVLAGHRRPAWGWYEGPDAVAPGWRGILEPIGRALGPDVLGEASLIWCSALAVTRAGDRLGTGGGWYDRALHYAAPSATVGVLCFDDEVLDALPTDPWDRRVDVVVTPRRVLTTTQR
jgi:5-formyltetrahydrofolate cyclo-ligase